MECGICLEVYSSDVNLKRRPQLLPCGHDYCESCLQQLHTANKEVIKCPLCQRHHVGNPNSLPIAYRMMQDTTTRHICTGQNCQQSAITECPHCQNWFCKEHFPNHEEEVFEMCSQCLEETEHKLKVMQTRKSAYNNLYQATKQTNEFLKTKIQELQNLSTEIDKLVDEQDNPSKVLPDTEYATTQVVNDLRLLVQTRRDVSKTWTKCQEVKECQQIMIKGFPDIVRMQEVQRKLKNIMNEAVVSLSVDAEITYSPSVSKRDESENTKKARFTITPQKIVKIDGCPFDLTVVKNATGFSLQHNVVVRGSRGSPLPRQALLVTLFNVGDHILVCDENGEVKGKINLRYHRPSVCRITVNEDNNDIIISDNGNKRVMKLLLSGDDIATSEDGVFSDPLDLCVLPNDRVAVSDRIQEAVKILSVTNLSLIRNLRHSRITDPLAIAATSSYLVVTLYPEHDRFGTK